MQTLEENEVQLPNINNPGLQVVRQGVHNTLLLALVYEFAGQGEHCRSLDDVSVLVLYVPGLQTEITPQVKAFKIDENVPEGQDSHTLSVDVVTSIIVRVPRPQILAETQAEAPDVFLNFPVSQSTHVGFFKPHEPESWYPVEHVFKHARHSVFPGYIPIGQDEQ